MRKCVRKNIYRGYDVKNYNYFYEEIFSRYKILANVVDEKIYLPVEKA
jgi:hypothetical protein